MGLKVAFMTRHHATLICEEARKLLLDAGFEIISNDTGRILSRDEQKELIKDAYAIVAGTEKYDADMLSVCKNLKVVTRFGVGTDNFDLETMKKRGVQVGVIANHNAVAEFALTLILATMKNLTRYDAVVREGKWSRFPMRELSKKTVGIVGFGRIGRRLAELLTGFDVEILSYDPYMNSEAAAQRKVMPVSLEELLARSDVVSLHLPSTAETHHMINAQTLSMMKDGAYLINTSRSGLIDEAALVRVLGEKKIAGAFLDVFDHEPPSVDDPLVQLDNVTLTPHMAGGSNDAFRNTAKLLANALADHFQGKPSRYLIK